MKINAYINQFHYSKTKKIITIIMITLSYIYSQFQTPQIQNILKQFKAYKFSNKTMKIRKIRIKCNFKNIKHSSA